MSIPLPWAIALAVAGATGVLVALGIAAQRGVIAAPERPLALVAHLLGGGLAGFTALAFPPAWPLLAAVVGMLAIRSLQARRTVEVGLLMTGFGAAWTLLLGISILSAMTDPAVHAPAATGWFAFGGAVLVVGLIVVIADTVAAGSGRQS